MSTTAQQITALENALPKLDSQIAALNARLAKTKLSQYILRRDILTRIRAAEHKYEELYEQLLKLDPLIGIGDLYKHSIPKVKSGLSIRVEISLDGDYYSNPAPAVPANHVIYVRAIIDEAHKGTVGVPKTHEMAHLKWIKGKGYVAQDTIPTAGHDVYFCSLPLMITRRYKAPATNTKQNFMVYADVYERVD